METLVASYALVFLGIVLEGDIVLFTAAFMARLGYFELVPLTSVVLVGVAVRDLFWFIVGHRIHNPASRLSQWIHRVAEPADVHLRKRPLHTLLIAKFVYGLHFATILRAGMLALPFRRFFRADMLATVVWFIVVGSLGYLSGSSFLFVKKSIRFFEITILVGLAALFLIHRFLARYSKKSLLSREQVGS